MKNIRQRSRPRRPHHEDFNWIRSCTPPKNSTKDYSHHRGWKKYCATIRQGWDFGIVMWGAVGRQEEVSLDMAGQRMLISDVSEHRKVKEIMNDIDWASHPGSWMGAPNIDPIDVIVKYEEKKQEWIATNRL